MILSRALSSLLLASALVVGPRASLAQQPPQISLELLQELQDTVSSIVTDITGSGRAEDDNVLFVALRSGTIRTIDLADPSATAGTLVSLGTTYVTSSASERGLLGLAFPPDYNTTGHFFVHYSCSGSTADAECTGSGAGMIARLTGFVGDSNILNTKRNVACIGQPNSNHNGGGIQFGPDGYLYIAMGDGGSSYDSAGGYLPDGYGQKKLSLLGKMLRVNVTNVDPQQTELPRWEIPGDNPFVNDTSFAPEIWSIGLRNPWRFSFDRLTGDMWIGDVGQNYREEINFEPAGGPGGFNYGWCGCQGFSPISACCSGGGSHCPVALNGCTASDSGTDYNGVPYLAPAFDYGYISGSRCSVTGGYVYRGGRYGSLQGKYFYSDYCENVVRAAEPDGNGGWATTNVLANGPATPGGLSTFGEDNSGELYAGDSGGRVYQITDPDYTTERPTDRPSVSGAPSQSRTPTQSPVATVGCPATYQASRQLDENLVIRYSVALAPGEAYEGVLCAQLELARLAWVGFAASLDDQMSGSDAVIGRPLENATDDRVSKFHLSQQNSAGVNVVDSSRQTLLDASLVQDADAGTTTMTFRKKLVEPGEIAIDGLGINKFLYAYGAEDEFIQHSSNDRGPFDLDFTPCSTDCTGGTFCEPIDCINGLCQDAPPPCSQGQTCAEPACTSCDSCAEADCTATAGCSWESNAPTCVSGTSCAGCSEADCPSPCRWNKGRQECTGTFGGGSGTCSGTSTGMGTCTDACSATEPSETSCSDGEDNDCDGLADCADGDCSSDPACGGSSECIPGSGSGANKASCSFDTDCSSCNCKSGQCKGN